MLSGRPPGGRITSPVAASTTAPTMTGPIPACCRCRHQGTSEKAKNSYEEEESEASPSPQYPSVNVPNGQMWKVALMRDPVREFPLEIAYPSILRVQKT